jgi:hypothetical protein
VAGNLITNGGVPVVHGGFMVVASLLRFPEPGHDLYLLKIDINLPNHPPLKRADNGSSPYPLGFGNHHLPSTTFRSALNSVEC